MEAPLRGGPKASDPKSNIWLSNLHDWSTAKKHGQEDVDRVQEIDQKIHEVVKAMEEFPQAKDYLRNYLTFVISLGPRDYELKRKCLHIYQRIKEIDPKLIQPLSIDQELLKVLSRPNISPEDLNLIKCRLADVYESSRGFNVFFEFLNQADLLIEALAESKLSFDSMMDYIGMHYVTWSPEVTQSQKEKIGEFVTKLYELKLIADNQRSEKVLIPMRKIEEGESNHRVLFGLLANGVSNRTLWKHFFTDANMKKLYLVKDKKNDDYPEAIQRFFDDHGRYLDRIFELTPGENRKAKEVLNQMYANFFDQMNKDLDILVPIIRGSDEDISNLGELLAPTAALILSDQADPIVASRFAQLVGNLRNRVPELHHGLVMAAAEKVNSKNREQLNLIKDREPDFSKILNLYTDKSLEEWRQLIKSNPNNRQLHEAIFEKLFDSKDNDFGTFTQNLKQIAVCADIADELLVEKKAIVRKRLETCIVKIFTKFFNYYEGTDGLLIEHLKAFREVFQVPQKSVQEEKQLDLDEDFVLLSTDDASSKTGLTLDLSKHLPLPAHLLILRGIGLAVISLNKDKEFQGRRTYHYEVPGNVKRYYTPSEVKELQKQFDPWGTKIILVPFDYSHGRDYKT